MTSPNGGLIFAMLLDGQGGGSELDWSGVERHWNDEVFVWVNLDYTKDSTKKWLNESSNLDATTCNALISNETRPRCIAIEDGLLINLRGVNLNPGSDPEDMVSLRCWVEHNRLITLSHRKLLAIDDTQNLLKNGKGPKNAVDILLTLAESLVARAGTVIGNLDDEIDSLEEEILAPKTQDLRSRIADTRRTTIGIRRFLAPQRDAMSHLMTVHVNWIKEENRTRIREVADQVTRYVEDLDAIRERAAILQEGLSSRLAEQINKTMYVLAVLTAVFLPLGLLTGLLGINVGGMPGTNSPLAFWIVCVLLVVIMILEIIILRRKKWL